MIESKESKTRDIPIWLTAFVLILSVGGGGWLIWWYMRDQPQQVVEVPEDKAAMAAARAPRLTGGGGPRGGGGAANDGNNPFFTRGQRDPNADGIREYGRNSFIAKIGNTKMLINYANATRFDISPQYVSLRSPDEAE